MALLSSRLDEASLHHCWLVMLCLKAVFQQCMAVHLSSCQMGFIGLWMQWQLEAGVRHPVVIHGQDVAATEALLLHRAAELQSQVCVEC